MASSSSSPRHRTTANNAIILCGNGGVGKSYICNRIFGLHSTPTKFKSSCSVRSVTTSIQWGKIQRHGVDYTIIDTPGFFDNHDPTKTAAQVDGENMCSLIAAMESCTNVLGIVYVFTDRFLQIQKLWFDRLRDLLTSSGGGGMGQLIVVHNKVDTSLELRAQNKAQVRQIAGGPVEYFCLGFHPEDGDIERIVSHVTQLRPFHTSNLRVPDICYVRKEHHGSRFKMTIPNSTTTRDEGETVTLTTHGVRTITETRYEDPPLPPALGILFGGPLLGALGIGGRREYTVTRQVPTTSTRQTWAPKMVTRRQVGVFVKVFKVRFDGTKDFVRNEEVAEDLREEEIVRID